MPATYSRRRRQTAELNNTTHLFDDVIKIIGDRWATLILRSLFTGINQFQDILEDTSVATNILSDRLSELIEKGIIYTAAVPSDSRQIKYKFSEKGLSLYPVIVTMLEWGDKWLPDPKGPPLLLKHEPCGQALKVELICSTCKEIVLPTETSFELST